ncbi:MAG: hypothetical protein KDD38_06055 [Bdellovibrionales bacterium]|nr:hypothetical protein [Bdellovibrionales bacterium]
MKFRFIAFTLAFISISRALAGAYESLPDTISRLNEIVKSAGSEPKWACVTTGNKSQPSPAVGRGTKSENRLWQNAGFENAKFETWPADMLYEPSIINDPGFTHEIDLSVVLYRGTSWDKESIRQRFKSMAKVLRQCKLKISKVKFIEADAYNGWLDVDGVIRKNGDRESQISEALPIKSRPVFVYLRSSRLTATGYAIPQYVVEESNPAKDTIWMTELSQQLSPNTSLEAHELAHVLLNSGHVDHGRNRNILHIKPNRQNNKIGNERGGQCDQMKKYGAVRSINTKD